MRNVSFAYGPNKAIEHVSGDFCQGSLTAVAGPNGAGKSTFLKLVAGILKPHAGTVTLAPSLVKRVAYLPQDSAMERDFPITVWQAASTGLWPEAGSGASLRTAPMRTRIEAALDSVGLREMEGRQIGMLSGGQFQRLLFARLLLQDPQLVLLDEPFAAVDAETTKRLMQILLRWHQEGRTIICVLHDLLLIRKYFPDSFVLSGKCLGRGHTHALFEQKLLSFDLDMAELIKAEDHHDAS